MEGELWGTVGGLDCWKMVWACRAGLCLGLVNAGGMTVTEQPSMLISWGTCSALAANQTKWGGYNQCLRFSEETQKEEVASVPQGVGSFYSIMPCEMTTMVTVDHKTSKMYYLPCDLSGTHGECWNWEPVLGWAGIWPYSPAASWASQNLRICLLLHGRWPRE